MTLRDPHSYNDDTQPETESLEWRATVDFARRRLDGEATLRLRAPSRGGPLDLDTRGLTILDVRAGDPVPWELAPAEPILGARLRITLPAGAQAVTIRYHTGEGASALQWLDPPQTAGGVHPYLFTQCQAIHARSVVPLQDTPRLRIRYRAALTVPAPLRALMAAAFVSREVDGATAMETWEMPQPIPPYLLAFAVGDLASRDVGPRTRVWAEPSVVEGAAWELAAADDALRAGEKLFGPYDWDRYDLLVMPPSFPYGGMENPRLTFLTPTIITGDRSLVSVVAHELAHSWTGNLVSSASAEHFWLNEGWTVWAERRILEALAGPQAVALHVAIGRHALDEALLDLAARPHVTRLRTHLAGVDPDEVFSVVPYEKGYLFVRALEEAVGRARFDAFVRAYMAAFRFQSITTEQFLAFTERELPGALAAVQAREWVDAPGVPADAPTLASARVDVLEAAGRAASPPPAGDLEPLEWKLYLHALPRPAPASLCASLDAAHDLTHARNPEVLTAWLDVALHAGHAPAAPAAAELLGKVGRMKYLRPLYKALAERPDTLELARRTFAAHAAAYHPIARAVIAKLLNL